MTQEQIPSYTRLVNGKPVTVKSHVRANNEAAEAASKVPGRPPVAAHAGKYAGDRVLPNIWAADLNKKAEQAMADTDDPEEQDKVLPAAKNLQEATQRILDELSFYNDTPEVVELRTILMRLPTDTVNLSHILPASLSSSTETLMLALQQGKVQVKGYFRRTKHGLVHVRPYNQIRDLMSLLGGPPMAAKKGITPNLLQRALREDNRKPRGSGVTPSTPAPSLPSAPTPQAKKKSTPDTPQAAPKAAPEVAPAPQGSTPQPRKTSAPQTRPTPAETAPSTPQTRPTPAETSPSTPKVQTWTNPYSGNSAFNNPYTGQAEQLGRGETIRVRDDGIAVFKPNGEMKHLITPSGIQNPPTLADNSSGWRDIKEPSLIQVDGEAPSTEESFSLPSLDKPRVFTHPSGKKIHLPAGSDISRHRTTQGSYLITNDSGMPTHRVAPSGRKYAINKADVDAFEPLPNSVDEELNRAPIDQPSPRRRDRLSEPNAPSPETEASSTPTPSEESSEESPEWDSSAPQIFDENQPRVWNSGVDAATHGLSLEEAWDQHSSKHSAVRDVESRRKFKEGFDHYLEQREMYDNWNTDKESIAEVGGFTFDRTLFPDAWEGQATAPRAQFILPDLNDNDSWRRGRPSRDGALVMAGYRSFKPGFGITDADITSAIIRNQTMGRSSGVNTQTRMKQLREFKVGWDDAKKEWEQSFGVDASQSEEWNRGFQHAANGKDIPGGASDDFKRGFTQAESKPPEAPSGFAVQVLTPSLWADASPEDKAAFRARPHVNEVLDSHGNEWTRVDGSFGRGPSWESGEPWDRDYKKVPTSELVDKYLGNPQHVSPSEAVQPSKLPVGSTIKGNDATVRIEPHEKISVQGIEVEPHLKEAVLTHQKYDGGRVSTYGGMGSIETKMAHHREFERDLSNSLEGLHPITKSLFAGRVHVEDAQDKRAPSTTNGGYLRWNKNDPSSLPSMHFPKRLSRTVKEKERITPNKNGVSMLVQVDEGNDLVRTMAISHETGKYLDGVLNRLLEPDERKAMYREFRDALLTLVPEDKRDSFGSFIPSGDRLKTPRTQRPKPNDPDYEFFRAFEFVNQNAPQSIQKDLSKVAARNPKELIGQAWTQHRFNSEPSPISRAIGNSMERGLDIGGGRLEARLNNRDFTERFSDVGPSYPTPREALQNRMNGPVVATEGFFTIGEGDHYFSVSRRGSKVTLPSKLTRDAAFDHDEMVEHMRELGRTELRSGVTDEQKSLTAARLGYDFSPGTRVDMASRALRIASSEFELSAREEKFWNKVQDALDADDSENIPTPQDILGSGRHGNRIMKKLGEDGWVAHMSLSRTVPQGIPSYEGEAGNVSTPHGIDVDPNDSNASKEMYSKVTRIFSEMPPTRLSEMVSPLRNDYSPRTDAELAATAVVDYHYGSKDAKYLGIVDAIETRVVSGSRARAGGDPEGMEGYQDWLGNYSEAPFLTPMLDRFPQAQGYINDKLRDGEVQPMAATLDRAFASVPETTSPMRIYVPTSRQTLVPPGSPVRDKGFMRGTSTPSTDSSEPQLVIDLPTGSKVLFDGSGFILPRNTQYRIDTADNDSNVMAASIIDSPLSDVRFVLPPQQRAGRHVWDVAERIVQRERERAARLDPNLGREYNPDTPEYHAQQVLNPVARHERHITASVTGSVRLHGGTMNRMGRRMDTHADVTKNIAQLAREFQMNDRTLTNDQAFSRAVASLSPSLHYTTTFKGNNYSQGMMNAINRLKERGHTVNSIVNRMGLGEGARATMTSPMGTQYTIDFHSTGTRVKSSLAGRLLVDAMGELGESVSLHSEEMQMAQFVARNAVVPPGAELVGEGLAEAFTSAPMPPAPPPPPTKPPEMKTSEMPWAEEDSAVLQAILRMDAKSIADLYYGIGIPPQVWFALLRKYNGNLPPELLV